MGGLLGIFLCGAGAPAQPFEMWGGLWGGLTQKWVIFGLGGGAGPPMPPLQRKPCGGVVLVLPLSVGESNELTYLPDGDIGEERTGPR